MLDPQARFLPNVNPSNPGKIVDFTSKDFPINEYHDQFSPYELHSDARGGWNKSWNRPFNGTLFRLPLRTKVQAESSLLSKRHLSLEDAKQLLLSLQEEAASMLLFLKNIEQIEIFAIEPSTTDGNRSPPVPRLLFGCNIADITTELRSRRSYISDSRHLSAALKASISVDFSLKIVCRGERAEDVRDELWELCNQLGGPEATAIAGAPENALLRLIPWGGVAACIDIQSQRGTKSKSVRDGVAYCFLPLPIQTQLPVMLNGFFELSSNRRDVWQSGSDMTGEGQTRANWNIALMVKENIMNTEINLLFHNSLI
jgi:sacsin